MKRFKDTITRQLKELTGLDKISLEIPPDLDMGDFAFPCFVLSKKLKKSPQQIAQDLCRQFRLGEGIEKAEVKGAYVNFFIDKDSLATAVLPKIQEERSSYGKATDTGVIQLIESPSPNTNKPLHLGHLRNIVLGDALSQLSRFAGKQVHIIDIVNDRGIHICKSMLAYQRWGDGQTPQSTGIKPDHFVGSYYVRFCKEAKKDPSLEDQAQEMLLRWESGDKETIKLWKTMNSWVLEGFEQTYKRLGFKIEKHYFESETYTHGKEIVLKGLKEDIFSKEEDGKIIADLTDKGLDKKVLLRSNGTSVYMTQDIYLAKLRYQDYRFDEMIYVVANEQEYHFKVLFEIFDLLRYPFAQNCTHLSYGMVELPDGKMKSREGNVVDIDDLLEELMAMTKKELSKRYPDISKDDLLRRSKEISDAAFRFFLLKHDPLKNIRYDPKASLSFEGETGPYVQYTHARICSILRKAGQVPDDPELRLLREKETQKIIKMLAHYPQVVEQAALRYNPSLLTRYLLDLCQSFNEFYHAYPVLKEEKDVRFDRLYLIDCVRIVIAGGLKLCGISPIQKM